jgi:hypothetical protein
VTLMPKYSDRDLAEARSLQWELKTVLDSAQPGKGAAYSLQEVRQLCDRALLAIADGPFQEKVCEIERYAADFLAAAKRAGRGATPGAVVQRRMILSMLDAINDRLTNLETLRGGELAVPHASVSRKF